MEIDRIQVCANVTVAVLMITPKICRMYYFMLYGEQAISFALFFLSSVGVMVQFFFPKLPLLRCRS